VQISSVGHKLLYKIHPWSIQDLSNHELCQTPFSGAVASFTVLTKQNFKFLQNFKSKK
jgi:hypothetical protein